MYDFNTLKAGDKLMRKGRMFGRMGYTRSKWFMVEWVEVFVESVSPKFYVVEGDKHRRDAGGIRNLAPSYHIPGVGDAPTSSNSEEFSRREALFDEMRRAPGTLTNRLEQLATLEEAAEFATRFRQLEDELDAAIKRAQ